MIETRAVTEDIVKLILPYKEGMDGVNSYLIKGENGYTVIDTGHDTNETRDIWEEILNVYRPVEKIVLTHTHQDHIGCARWLQEEKGIPVHVSKLGYEEMKKRMNHEQFENNLIRLIKGHGGPNLDGKLEKDASIYDFTPDHLFDETEMIQLGDREYEPVFTPGHAPDHYCFYQKETENLFVGDHVLAHLSPVIGLWLGEELNPLGDYLSSLEKLKAYKTTIAYPGHGEDIMHLDERLEALIARHEHRLEQMVDFLEGNKKSVMELTEEIYGTTDIILGLSAFMAVLTRLIYLESLGEVRRTKVNGIYRFQVVLEEKR